MDTPILTDLGYGGISPYALHFYQVDVWSAAVMHFQMLFGRRPFGEGLTQERILREDVMLNARKVAFPSKPAVSQDCKDFISRFCSCDRV